jgi:hypothetical protein
MMTGKLGGLLTNWSGSLVAITSFFECCSRPLPNAVNGVMTVLIFLSTVGVRDLWGVHSTAVRRGFVATDN